MQALAFQNETEWHLLRKQGIGGSDAAAVLGMSKWKTPLQLYYEKTTDEIQTVDNEAVRWGKVLEPVIRQEYAERTGRTILQPDGVLRHPKFGFMQANLDGYTDDARLVEIKTARASNEWGEPGTDEVPTEYLLQVQHYLAVTGLEVADLAVLIGGQDFRIYEIPADKELHGLLIEKEAAFWKRIETQNPPEPISQSDFLRVYNARPGVVVADEKVLTSLKKLKEIRQALKDMEADETTLKTEIMAYLKEKDTLSDAAGKTLLTWKQSKAPVRLDIERLKEEKPEIYEEFKKVGEPTRKFLVK